MARRGAYGIAVLSAIVAFLLAGTPNCLADEITDAIQEGLTQYKNGNFTEAVGSLDYAAQLIRQKKGESMQTLLPPPLPGWNAEDVTSQAMGSAMFGGGVAAERRYTKDSAWVEVRLLTDSPLMQSAAMMLTNPAFALHSGGKLEKIAGQKAIVKYSSEDQSGDIQIVVANRFLVTVDGGNVSREDLIGYASGIDFAKMSALP